MLEKVFSKQHIRINQRIFIGLFIAMLMAPYVANTGVRILVLSLVLISFVNAIVIVYKLIRYVVTEEKRQNDISS
ncbi:MAG: hypothetical protein IJ274_15450 [Lachnospiraceae bacterium]|nr:hypothetical protein [Lachnospiraceae bacterium]MBQ8041235.1 hypothetical protein [Lachnospiraceae bacterium]